MDPLMETGSTLRFDFGPDDLTLDEASLLSRLGYPDAGCVSEHVRRVLDQIEEPLRKSCRPKAVARFVELVEVKSPGCGFCVPGGFVFSTRLVSGALFPAKAWAAFALTIGEPMLEKPGQNRGDLLLEYCADAMASVMAEGLARTVHERLAKLMEESGLVAGHRYSPGYCDWPVTDNRELLALADAESIGITLTSGGMMSPRKSVSAIMAFGWPDSAIREPACRRCEKRCPHYRR